VASGPAPNCKLKYVSKVVMVELHETCSNGTTETMESMEEEKYKGTK
jgi:hypothetical protein